MNDIYGAFANAYNQGDIQVKADPKKIFNIFSQQSQQNNNNSTRSSITEDLENSRSTSGSNILSQSIDSIKGKFFSSSSQQTNQDQQPILNNDKMQPMPIRFVISKMNDKKDYTKAFACLFLSGLFLMLAFLTLPTIILSPQRFTTLFTISMILLIVALAFLNGPQTYAQKLTEKKNVFASCILIGSIILSLYFSIIAGSYLLSILFCIIEFNAVLLFFCNTFPAGKTGMRLFGGAAKTMLSAPFK
eukprot:403350952